MPDVQDKYKELTEWHKSADRLDKAIEILMVDGQMTMQSGSEADRAAMVETIAKQRATIITDPKIPDLLQAVEEDIQNLSDIQQTDVRLMRRFWVHEACLPIELAGEYQKTVAEGEAAHSKNHKTGDWDIMYPHYQKAFDMAARVGEYKAEALGIDNPYNALIDFYSPGLSCEIIDPFFGKLNEGLKELLPLAYDRQKEIIDIDGTFPFDEQKKLSSTLINGLGLDMDRAVVYFTKDAHPFMAGPSDDVRLVTRLDDEDFLPAVFASLHEAGHALYQQNLLPSWGYHAVGNHMGMAIHESQSMIIEYQASMSEPYVRFLARTARKEFGRSSDPAFSEENILAHMRKVEPSYIRVDADEMTYPFHIMTRYELERQIFAGKLEVKDLPEAFNNLIEEKMGIRPSNNAQGCMQDVHWPGAAQGYFPAYTFGAAIAAQLFSAATKNNPEILEELGEGRFDSLREWLRENIHSKGSTLGFEELIKNATGTELGPDAYINHLGKRYCGLTAG